MNLLIVLVGKVETHPLQIPFSTLLHTTCKIVQPVNRHAYRINICYIYINLFVLYKRTINGSKLLIAVERHLSLTLPTKIFQKYDNNAYIERISLTF